MLTGTFGKTIDVDVRTLTVEDREQLVEYMRKYKLLSFPQQALTEAQLVDFCSIFGSCWRNDDPDQLGGNGEAYSSHTDTRQVTLVSNKPGGVLGSLDVPWHNDVGHKPINTKGGTLPLRSLYGVRIPSTGAITRWVDTEQLYDITDDDVLSVLRSAVGIYEAPYPTTWGQSLRPMVVRDPITNQKALHFDLLFLRGIVGVCHEEFLELRQYFKDKIEQCDVYVHHWKAGDLVVYNNYNTMHHRPAVTTSEERTLWRTTFQIEELIPQELRSVSVF